MNSNRWMLFVFSLYLIIFFAHALFLQKTVYGDGIFYFSWIRSAVVDHDIHFANEYAHFGVSAPGNKHPIGTPLFWLPWYAQAHMVLGGTGFALSYQLVVGIVSVLAVLAGLVLLYRLLTMHFGHTTSLLATISIALSTNLLFYGAVDPVNSHAVSFFATTVFLSFVFSKHVSPFLTGCALGYLALVRPQDAIMGILAFKKRPFAVFGGAALVFSLQAVAWYLLYGTPWISPYLSSGETFHLWPNHALDVLFSPNNGFFLWTPMAFLAVMGFSFWKDARRVWFLALFIAEVAVVGSWSIWWQGASYSGRMLVSTLPILAFGLAALFTKLTTYNLRAKQVLLAIIWPLAIINALLILRFLLQT